MAGGRYSSTRGDLARAGYHTLHEYDVTRGAYVKQRDAEYEERVRKHARMKIDSRRWEWVSEDLRHLGRYLRDRGQHELADIVGKVATHKWDAPHLSQYEMAHRYCYRDGLSWADAQDKAKSEKE